MPLTVAALYRFAPLADPAGLRVALRALCAEAGVKGTLILAHEGVNGTVAGTQAAVARLIAFLEAVPGLSCLDVKYSHADEMPFHRMKVRLKREIVTMGVEGLDAAREAGTHVEPGAWNALVDDPDTVVIDTRNAYEVSLGTFRGAVDPGTESFAAFPAWAQANRARLQGRKVAMFCTGGIRCEKATAYVRTLGVEEVFHLRGGILRYLEEVSPEDSRWDGECFVFDERVSVGHGLAGGEATLCRGCRHPLTASDRASPHFVAGVSCPHCRDSRGQADRARYAERQKQVELAARRGGRHVGGR